jgi:hypothetical protein
MAQWVLALHLAIIAFNIFGLIFIPVGAWRGWAFVRKPGWRLVHVVSMATVAVQAAAGRACFLTDWQAALAGAPAGQPMIMRWVNSVIFWPMPIWVFVALYLVLFAYTLALLWWVRPRWRDLKRSIGPRR